MAVLIGIFVVLAGAIVIVWSLGKPPRCTHCGGQTQVLAGSAGSVQCEDCGRERDLAWGAYDERGW